MRNVLKIACKLVALCSFLAGTGCVRMSGSLTHLLKTPDFKKSELIVNGTAIANGTDQLVMYVHLLNSDNSVVVNYKPEYIVTAGSALVPSQCFTSDSNGLSICILKALTPGQRTIKIENITTIDLHSVVTFLPIPLNNHQLQAVSGSLQKNTAGTYSVKGTVGGVMSTPVQKAGGYTIYGSVQGAFTQ